MDENEQISNPFTSEWSWFGFNGEPSPGFDYSWLEVQNYLCLIGSEEYIQNCKLFSSSRNPNIFLIRTQDGIEEVWDISDLKFEPLSKDKSTLVASLNDKCIHISNVSISFIELLMKTLKLPFNSLSNFHPFALNTFKIKTITEHPNLPDKSTQVGQ